MEPNDSLMIAEYLTLQFEIQCYKQNCFLQIKLFIVIPGYDKYIGTYQSNVFRNNMKSEITNFSGGKKKFVISQTSNHTDMNTHFQKEQTVLVMFY
jgi:hypothetical protein